jgi:hypothetical protein
VTDEQAPQAQEIRARLDVVFGDGRVSAVVVHGWHLTFRVDCIRYWRPNGDHVRRVAMALGVGIEAVEFWPLHNWIEFTIDLDPVTPVETPRGRR